MKGDERLEALWQAHHQRVYAYALRRGGPADAQDVLAETFAVAWRRIDAVPGDALPWLLGVARKVLANQRRADARQTAVAEALQSAAVVRGPGAYEPDGTLLTALAGLPENDREVLLLSAWDGLDAGAIARVLGTTQPAVWVRMHRARARLRAALEPTAEPAAATPTPIGDRP